MGLLCIALLSATPARAEEPLAKAEAATAAINVLEVIKAGIKR